MGRNHLLCPLSYGGKTIYPGYTIPQRSGRSLERDGELDGPCEGYQHLIDRRHALGAEHLDTVIPDYDDCRRGTDARALGLVGVASDIQLSNPCGRNEFGDLGEHRAGRYARVTELRGEEEEVQMSPRSSRASRGSLSGWSQEYVT